mmetsp:Transcript_21340/g.48476  ORF Transcript_21340/g.48476 Transcript_21340/m.48476 type:complete len:117 (-) Transcript_21340:49-399(-)
MARQRRNLRNLEDNFSPAGEATHGVPIFWQHCICLRWTSTFAFERHDGGTGNEQDRNRRVGPYAIGMYAVAKDGMFVRLTNGDNARLSGSAKSVLWRPCDCFRGGLSVRTCAKSER